MQPSKTGLHADSTLEAQQGNPGHVEACHSTSSDQMIFRQHLKFLQTKLIAARQTLIQKRNRAFQNEFKEATQGFVIISVQGST